jgi:cytochrome P450
MEVLGGEPLLFNPFDPVFRRDPYPFYDRLRAEDPVHEFLFGTLVLTRYDDCVQLLRDPRGSSDARKSDFFAEFLADQQDRLEFFQDRRPFLFLDPPDHTRLRGLVSKAFTPKVVEGLRPRIEQLVGELLDAAAAAGGMEVIEDFAYPLPVVVISELLGVPAGDHETFKGWSRDLARSLDPDFSVDAATITAVQATANEFAEYFRALIERRRSDPGDDLLSALIAVEDQGDILTENELLATLTLLLVAGHETTVNLIGNGTLALLRHPDQLDRLRADPGLARSTVEEVLRYDSPVQMTGRTALEDIEVGGKVLPKGKQAVVLLAAANHDPAHFPDPRRIDVTRSPNPHRSFSFGAHFCLGASLARLEGTIALAELARRFPRIELETDALVHKDTMVLRGLEAMPVRLG